MLFTENNLLLVVVCCTSFVICVGVVLTQNLHGRWSHDSNEGIQKIHTQPTPRIGGVGVFLSMLIAYVILESQAKSSSHVDSLKIMRTMLLGGSLCFLAGLAEDVTKKVSVSMRLVACLIAALLAVFHSSISITDVGLPWIDSVLSWKPEWSIALAPAAIFLTCIAIAGLANAFNIIDGFNGLSSGVAMVVCAGVMAIAARLGDMPLLYVSSLLSVAIFGFWLTNWPYGKLFLGDGGAYFIGFCIAWLVILLPARNPSVSPWASLLLISYPVAEVLFSVIRRIRRSGHHPGAPDKVHMHHLVYARWIRKYFSRSGSTQISGLANGMTALAICIANMVIVAITYYIHHSQLMLMIAFIGVIIIFYFTYTRLASFKS